MSGLNANGCNGDPVLDQQQVTIHHVGYHLIETDLWFPAKVSLGLAKISYEQVDLGRSEIYWINSNKCSIVGAVYADFIRTLSFPAQRYVDLGEGGFSKFSNAARFARCKHPVARLILLQDLPHPTNEVARIAPVPFGVEVPKVKTFLLLQLYGRGRPCNLARHKSFTT